MKTCPVCESRTFDDAEICYGCLHQFEAISADDTPAVSDQKASANERNLEIPLVKKPLDEKPSQDRSGWSLRFEGPGYRAGSVAEELNSAQSENVGGAGTPSIDTPMLGSLNIYIQLSSQGGADTSLEGLEAEAPSHAKRVPVGMSGARHAAR